MAAKLANENPEVYSGLFPLASYPSEGNDLTDYEGGLVSIYGSEDSVLSMEGFNKGMGLLPESALLFEIEGGIHAQFGNYGEQDGDSLPGISSKRQQELTASYIIELLYN